MNKWDPKRALQPNFSLSFGLLFQDLPCDKVWKKSKDFWYSLTYYLLLFSETVGKQLVYNNARRQMISRKQNLKGKDNPQTNNQELFI